jgi:hypothetical protein
MFILMAEQIWTHIAPISLVRSTARLNYSPGLMRLSLRDAAAGIYAVVAIDR